MKNGFVSGLHPVCPRLWHRDTRALFTVFTQIWGSRSLASPLGISRLPCQPPRQSQHRALNPHLSQAVDQVDREPVPPPHHVLRAVHPGCAAQSTHGAGLRAQGSGSRSFEAEKAATQRQAAWPSHHGTGQSPGAQAQRLVLRASETGPLASGLPGMLPEGLSHPVLRRG